MRLSQTAQTSGSIGEHAYKLTAKHSLGRDIWKTISRYTYFPGWHFRTRCGRLSAEILSGTLQMFSV